MRALILDSEAFSQLARRQPGAAHAALTAAYLEGCDVVVPAAVLAEQYCGGAHDQRTDACLSRNKAILITDTTRDIARLVGNLLARAGLGSEDHVDATVVAAAVSRGGGVIATGDVDDLETLSDGFPNITVQRV